MIYCIQFRSCNNYLLEKNSMPYYQFCKKPLSKQPPQVIFMCFKYQTGTGTNSLGGTKEAHDSQQTQKSKLFQGFHNRYKNRKFSSTINKCSGAPTPILTRKVHKSFCLPRVFFYTMYTLIAAAAVISFKPCLPNKANMKITMENPKVSLT